jgi:hypothetical protein
MPTGPSIIAFCSTHGDSVNTFVNPAPAFNAAQAFNEATGIMQRNIFQQRSEQEVYSTNLDVTGKLDIAGTRHDLLVGVDYYRSHNLYGSDGQWVAPNPALAIDIFNPGPSYGIARSVFDAALKTSSTALPRSDIYNQWHGVYLQDQVTIGKKLHLMLGGRYDWAETGRGRATTFSAATDALFNSTPSLIRKDQGFSPRLGVLYELTPQLSAYGTWTTSFGANNAPAANGRTFDPQVGEQYELGLKAQLFESRLLGTLAAYKLTKDNILVADLNTADPNDRIANKQGSQGIELDLTGRVSRYLSLIASYAYTETKVIEDHAAGSPTKGNRLANVPKHSGSMSVRYDLNGQGAKGLSMGMGAFVAGKREVDLANTAHCWAMCVWMPSWPTAAGSLAARGPRPSSTCATCSIPSTTNRPTRTPTSRRAWGLSRRAADRDRVAASRILSTLTAAHHDPSHLSLSAPLDRPALAGFLLVVGLTGSLLAFFPELERAINPEFYPVQSSGQRLSAGELAERVEARLPEARVNALYLVGNQGATMAVVSPQGSANRPALQPGLRPDLPRPLHRR